MVPFFVQIKCHLGKSYAVANALGEEPRRLPLSPPAVWELMQRAMAR